MTTINHYTGWLPRYMRKGYPESRRNGSEGSAHGGKNRRLSKTRVERHIYCSAHGHRTHPDVYARMCRVSDRLNGIKRIQDV
jgi:hypothetical protein